MTHHLNPTVGTVLNLIPATGTTHWKTPGGNTWTEPLIAWAVVVNAVEDSERQYDTSIEPVVLDEGRYPATPREYIANRVDGVQLDHIDVSTSPNPMNLTTRRNTP